MSAADVVPYGSTHALTLTLAALRTAPYIEDSDDAVVAAATYAAAFWAAYGHGSIPLVERYIDAPGWRCESADWSGLVMHAIHGHDAHLVKYTLACMDCADADPQGAELYRAAAERLSRWWFEHPPADDPLI